MYLNQGLLLCVLYERMNIRKIIVMNDISTSSFNKLISNITLSVVSFNVIFTPPFNVIVFMKYYFKQAVGFVIIYKMYVFLHSSNQLFPSAA